MTSCDVNEACADDVHHLLFNLVYCYVQGYHHQLFSVPSSHKCLATETNQTDLVLLYICRLYCSLCWLYGSVVSS